MEIKFDMIDNILIPVLSGEIDHHSLGEYRDSIDLTYDAFKARHIILDFREVTFMDSSGVGLIMGRYNKVRKGNGKLLVAGCNEHIMRILELAGIYTIARCFVTREEAIAALGEEED